MRLWRTSGRPRVATTGGSIARTERTDGPIVALPRNVAALLAALVLLATVGIAFATPAKPVGADTPIFQSGQVFASVGNSLVSVYSQSSGNPLANRPSTTGSTSPTPPAAPSTRRATSTSPTTTQATSANTRRAAPWTGSSPAGCRTPCRWPLTTRATSTWASRRRPTLPSSPAPGSSSRTSARWPPSSPVTTGSPWRPTSAPSTTPPRKPTSCATTCARASSWPTSTCSPSRRSTRDGLSRVGLRAPDPARRRRARGRLERRHLVGPKRERAPDLHLRSLPGCQGQLFAISLDPDGTSFWTGDANSGNVWEVNIATGAVQQQIDTHSGALFGLSVDDEVEVAAPATVTTATPSTLAIQPVSGDFSSPTPVSAVLTNPATGQPIANEPVTFTLNGSESCTGTTDDTGSATCVITPGEPASSYTLTASFGGDTSTSTPIGSNSSSSTFTVNPDTSSVTYSGPPRGQRPARDPVGDPFDQHPEHGHRAADQGRHLHHRFGFAAQSCSATTDVNGNVSCTIAAVDQPRTETVTTRSPATPTTPRRAPPRASRVSEPTTLTVNAGSGSFNGSTTVSGTLNDTNNGLPSPASR